MLGAPTGVINLVIPIGRKTPFTAPTTPVVARVNTGCWCLAPVTHVAGTVVAQGLWLEVLSSKIFAFFPQRCDSSVGRVSNI